MKIVFVTDLPSIPARKQNRVLSYTEARELKICADMGGVPEMFELISILPTRTPYNKSDEIFSYERKTAVKYDYLEGRKEDCFVNPAIQTHIEEFHKRIAAYPKSTVFIPLKSLAFYLLTNEVKFTAHIGSIERTRFGTAVIPAIHPEMLFRSPERRLYTARAIQRAYELITEKIEEPKTRFIIRPTFDKVIHTIERMLDEDKDIAADIETVSRHISCISICNDHEESVSIPFISHEGSNYIHCYTYEQEVKIIQRMRQLLTRNRIVWQNGSYDIQHITRSWGFVPRNDFDTMLMYHAIYPGLKKDLATLSSLYVPYYQYWKDEHKDFTTLPEDLNSYWTYNAKDSFYTLVIKEKLQVEIEKHGVEEQWQLLQQSEKHFNKISLRGVRIDKGEKNSLMDKLLPELQERQNRINVMAGYELNTSSSKQMQTFFYEEQGCKIQKNKKTFQPSCDDQALEAIATEDPLYRPLVNLIQSSRSIGVFLNTFVRMPLDSDGRMRCSYNVGGPETYRLSSSKNPFGSGGNLQNIPKGQEEEDGDDFKLPNLRRMFIPDEGMLLFDADLAGADAQVVAWEANDEDLKAKFRSGEKIHALNAKDMYGAAAGPDGKKAPYYKNAKMGTHLCLADGHEVLTPTGWQKVEDVLAETPIVVCKMDGTEARMERPLTWYHAEDELEMLEIEGQAYHQLVTPDHKIPYATDSKGVIRAAKAKDLPDSARLPKSTLYSGSEKEDPNWLRLLSAFHADGSIQKLQVRFHFKKHRKIERLLDILGELLIKPKIYEGSDGSTSITLASDDARWLITQGKQPTWEMLRWSRECLQAYVDELPHWDGSIGITSVSFSTVVPQTAEIIHTLLHLCGKSGNTYPKGNVGGLTVQINNRPLHRLTSGRIRRVEYSGGLHCPTVSTGFFLTRYRGKIAVTGNSNYGGTPRTLSKSCAMLMHEAELFQRRWFELHPGIKDWQNRVMSNLQSTGIIENRFGFRRIFYDRPDSVYTNALAWIPQSTIAIIIHKAMHVIISELRRVGILLQVHDSLVGQFPIAYKDLYLPKIAKSMLVPVPYEDPLVIGTSLDISEKSWGDLGPWC